jgi:hypothetical protein
MSYAITVLDVPTVVPPVTKIEYQIDNGPVVQVDGVPGTYPVGFLPPGTYSNRIRGRNLIGTGPWSDAKNKTITWHGILSYYGISEAVIWDLDQIGTLWQDSTGITPVTTYGDPVGKMDDVSGFANHFIQATSARRPTYARRPKSGIRNSLQFTEEFENAYWTKSGGTISTDSDAPAGFSDSRKLTVTGGFGGSISRSTTWAIGQQHTVSVVAKAAGFPTLQFRPTNDDAFFVQFDLSAGTVQVVQAQRWSNASITSLGNGWYICQATYTPQATTVTHRFLCTPAASGTNGILLTGTQIEEGTTKSNYQRVGSQFNVTEAGQPSINYLWCDGVDDCLQSATAIDFSNSYEMTVCVGARKLTDASQRSLIELGASVDANNGTFQLTAPNGASTSYAIRSRGTNTVTAEATGFAQPDMAILTGQIDISSDLLTLRRNGVQVATSSSDQGSGNFANATLFIGARNNASDRFQGHIHSGFVFNKVLDPAILIALENWVAEKIGVDL